MSTRSQIDEMLNRFRPTRIAPTIESSKLNDDELEVLDHLAGAFKAFCRLDGSPIGVEQDFTNAIHAAQYIIAFRVARRVDPEIWT